MRYLFYGIIGIALFTGCAKKTTMLLGSWTMENLQPKKYEKMAIVAFMPNIDSRSRVELALADAFEAVDVKAMSTFSLFTLAGNIEDIKKAGITDEQIEAGIKEKVHKNEIDAIMMISILDKRQHEQYVQGSGSSTSLVVGGSPYYSMVYPVYGYPYYGYYSYTVASTYTPGYYETVTDVFVEVNLYDVATEKLIWTGQTESKELTSVEKEAPKFAKIIVDDIIKKKALLRE